MESAHFGYPPQGVGKVLPGDDIILDAIRNGGQCEPGIQKHPPQLIQSRNEFGLDARHSRSNEAGEPFAQLRFTLRILKA